MFNKKIAQKNTIKSAEQCAEILTQANRKNFQIIQTDKVESEKDYLELFETLKAICKGEWEISHCKVHWELKTKYAYVAFQLLGDAYQWPIEVKKEWLDLGMIYKINQHLEKIKSPNRLYQYAPSHKVILLFLPQQEIEAMNQLTECRFI